MPKHHIRRTDGKSLLETIREAETREEIDQLMDLGKTFEDASDDTRSRWHKAAKKRRERIEQGKETAE